MLCYVMSEHVMLCKCYVIAIDNTKSNCMYPASKSANPNYSRLSETILSRMEGIPSANLRQQKLDQQRKLIEEKQRKKRQQQVS